MRNFKMVLYYNTRGKGTTQKWYIKKCCCSLRIFIFFYIIMVLYLLLFIHSSFQNINDHQPYTPNSIESESGIDEKSQSQLGMKFFNWLKSRGDTSNQKELFNTDLSIMAGHLRSILDKSFFIQKINALQENQTEIIRTLQELKGRVGQSEIIINSLARDSDAAELLPQEVVHRDLTNPGPISFSTKWRDKMVTHCNKSIEQYGGKLTVFKNLVMNRSFAFAKAKGGEAISSVKSRPEIDEMYSFKKGLFNLYCHRENPNIKRLSESSGSKKHYISQWFSALEFVSKPIHLDSGTTQISMFTVATVRYEYANVFWALVDIYDIFLTAFFLGVDRSQTHVLLVDAKPKSHLDSLWTTFFGKVSLLSQLPEKVIFTKIAWNFPRQFSPMLDIFSSLSYSKEFREQIFKAFGLDQRLEALRPSYKNCSKLERPLKVLFVWRRNYVAHPRNPSGVISRKIANENELLNATRSALKNVEVRGEQLDLLSMADQLKVIAESDIMIGMHGAAFAFSWFLPVGGGAIELYPNNHNANWHMEHIAKKNGILYNSWKNHNKTNENLTAKTTRVPPDIVVKILDDMIQNICHNKSRLENFNLLSKHGKHGKVRNDNSNSRFKKRRDGKIQNKPSKAEFKQQEGGKIQNNTIN